MDAFKVHGRLIDDYQSYTEGFVDIKDARLRKRVDEFSASGRQWPDPWLSLNPSFAAGGRIDELVTSGVLHPRCAEVFAVKKEGMPPAPFSLYRHQAEAIEAAHSGRSYVLTTGTGSGKSLAYIIPIVDHVLRQGSGGGLRAIVVYPMNALANSQREELDKFLRSGFTDPPVTYARYTGQEKHDERREILEYPPDVLLTNYVMLELMLTRPEERRFLTNHARGLQFLVLDELHTYRGRQGADVAMLVRRLRELTGRGESLQCIGTSATMSSGTSTKEQQRDVADVATRIFGADVVEERVIVETLVQATRAREPSPVALREAVRERGAVESLTILTHDQLRDDPLASWIEDVFGIRGEEGTGRLVRRTPTTVSSAGFKLAEITGQPVTVCENALRATLRAGSAAVDPETGRTFFAFRLHQFLSKGGSIYVTADLPETRRIVEDYQVVVADGAREERLYPVAFCRECGQDYLMARLTRDDGSDRFLGRHQMRPSDRSEGYLFISTEHEWPIDPVVEGRLPQSWLAARGTNPVVQARRQDVPRRVFVGTDGSVQWPDPTTPGAEPPPGHCVAAWIPYVFRFCLNCGVTYEALRVSELAKLVTLDREGRSSAMTVIASSIVRSLRDPSLGDIPKEARKLLTFVDNRQDASLQAGHFNDFVQVTQLRAALNAAVGAAGPDGLDTLDLGGPVADHLDLDLADFAAAPETLNKRPVRRALRNVVEYRAMRDLQRGQRVTLPNLEQTGLLRIVYEEAGILANRDDLWEGSHTRLESMRPAHREEIVRVLFDEMRRVLALSAEALTQESVDRLRRESREYLGGVFAVTEQEPDPIIGIAVPASGREGSARSVLNVTGRSAFGRWLRSLPYLPGLDTAEATDLAASLFEVLERHGLVVKIVEFGTTGYRLRSSQIVLHAGDGTAGAPDPVRRTFSPDSAPRVVRFFRDLYRNTGHELSGLRAAEHTAQVRADVREERERQFREARLPLLFCSPTMELGVDIASLNAVAMRNVPPTPANYAQRSGRAGRSGQQAIVVTYCASGNAHDTYYFDRSDQMVAGQVSPPRLDLANEDLVRSHVHAVWLAEALALTTEGLHSSMANVVDLTEDGYPLRAELRTVLEDEAAASRARSVATSLLGHLAGEVTSAVWWSEEWVGHVIDSAVDEFDAACNRWRELYRSAEFERLAAEKISGDTSATREARRDADRRRGEARQRIELLLNEVDSYGQSDFYTYRYLASEGFLPGYSFPRLPLAAYIPGSRRGGEGSWLQRPRFLAISEFGPGALIYHEGSRYQVSRIALPRDSGGAGGSDVVRTRAKVCQACHYHHDAEPGPDVCEQCGEVLPLAWQGLLQLQTVITRRRERISADEEERNRTGYELVTTYRFVPRGTHPGYEAAEVTDPDGSVLADLRYGDGAELRVTNLGRRNRAHPEVHGFYLDLVKGQWLSESTGEEFDPEEDLETAAQEVKKKDRVVPYVSDRRNVLLLRWSTAMSTEEAITLQYALERGMEVNFQLEDSELDSILLPDPQNRGRLLFVESAEGGAGVLRRVNAEPMALAQAARAALELMHVDPDTGEERPGACLRGCYRCLLSYGNQLVHEQIDRRLAVTRLQSLASSSARHTAREDSTTGASPATDGGGVAPTPPVLPNLPPRAAEFAALLTAGGHTRPVDYMTTRIGVSVAFEMPGRHGPTYVVIDEDETPQDVDLLVFEGDDVVAIRWDDDFAAVIAARPDVFGPPVAKHGSGKVSP